MTTSRQRWIQILTTTTRTTASVLLILALLRHGDVLILASRRARARVVHIARVVNRTIRTTVRIFKYTFELLESFSRWQTEIDRQDNEENLVTPSNRRTRGSILARDSSESEDDCERRQHRRCSQLVSTSTVPRSLDRLLAVAASPRGSSSVAAAGATAGAVAAARGPPALAIVDTCVKALSTPHGTHVLSVAVTSAIDALLGREARPNRLFSAKRSSQSGNTSRPVSHAGRSFPSVGDFNNMVANPNVRSLFTDVAERVTRTAVIHAFPSTPYREGSVRPPMHSSSPSVRNGVLNKEEKIGDDSLSSSPCTHSTTPYAQWDRLVLAVLRDRPFVRDVVRVAVAQAVRSYVLTHAELRTKGSGHSNETSSLASCSDRNDENNDSQQNASPNSGDSGLKNNRLANEHTENTPSSTQNAPSETRRGSKANGFQGMVPRKPSLRPASMWDTLARLTAVDIRRLLYQQHVSPSSTGWTVF